MYYINQVQYSNTIERKDYLKYNNITSLIELTVS